MKKASALVWAGTIVTILSAMAAIVAGLGNRYGFWDFRAGFTIVRWAVYVAIGAGLVALVGLVASIFERAAKLALVGAIGTVIAVATVLPAWNAQRSGARVPHIHDITTDTEHPPPFVAIVPLRQSAPNPPAYDGPKVAAQQKRAYPDIAPVQLALPPRQAFDRALQAARDTGWQIVAAVPGEGRIEAIDETFWFGFKDDVVIRVVGNSNGSRIDVRSKSRVGLSDRGLNAKRVRRYIAELQALNA